METTIMENQMEKKMENEMETGIILGLYRDTGKENGNYCTVYWGYIGIMENKIKAII